MSYPTLQVNGPDGEQFHTYSTRRWPLGTRLILQDGRRYVFCQAGASALAVGKLMQAEVPGANFDELVVPAAVAVGSRSVTVTNGATAIAADALADGFLNVEDDVGEGHLYKIEGNDAAGGGAALVIRLAPGNEIKVAWTTATTVGVWKSPFEDVIVQPSPPTAAAIGVTCIAVTANYYCWLQVSGPASVLIDGTVVIAQEVMPSNAIDGAVEAWGLTEGTPNVAITPPCGRVLEVAADTEYGLIFLDLP